MPDEYNQLPEGDKKKLKKVANFDDDKEFAMHQEMMEANEHLEGIHEKLNENLEYGKEMCEVMKSMHEDMKEMPAPIVNVEAPSPVVVPAPKVEVKPEIKIDLSKTNDLLQRILDKEQEDIEATLEIV